MREAFSAGIGLFLILSMAVPASAQIERRASQPVPSVDHLTVVRHRVWYVREGVPEGRAARFKVAGRGDPILGDWDGDGVTTPGYVTRGSWTVTSTLDGQSPRRFSYGVADDLPIVGDWDGDGSSDVGVYRNGVFLLRHRASGGDATRRIRFGRTGDVPVVGDWNGDGRTDLGVRRGGRWYLQDGLQGGNARWSIDYGRSSDEPLVGDWDGNGRDDLAIRRGREFHLRFRLTPGPADEVVTWGRATDWVLAWPSPAAVTRACASAAFRDNTSVAEQVALPDPALLRVGDELDHLGRQLRRALVRESRYLWKQRSGLYPSGNGHVDLLSTHRIPEYAIRPAAMEAFSFAVAARTETLPRRISAAAARQHAARVVASIACQHATTDRDGWGSLWQSAMWSYQAGAAAWLVWSDLSQHEQAAVVRMVTHEADRHRVPAPRYMVAADGKVLSKGDTKSEEVGWDANGVQLAAAMLPNHPHRESWLGAQVGLSLMAAAMPQDQGSDVVLNGVRVAEWQLGWNVNEDGTVTNHKRIHPDYTAAIHQPWTGAVLHTLAGQRVPEAVFHNAAEIYAAFSSSFFESPPYDPSGGTIYVPDSPDIYYPEGSTWGTAGRARFVLTDEFATRLGLDSAAATPGRVALGHHLAGQTTLQDRSSSGRTHLAWEEFPYIGAEEFTGQQLALAWLGSTVLGNGQVRLDRTAYDVSGTISSASTDLRPPPAEPYRSP